MRYVGFLSDGTISTWRSVLHGIIKSRCPAHVPRLTPCPILASQPILFLTHKGALAGSWRCRHAHGVIRTCIAKHYFLSSSTRQENSSPPQSWLYSKQESKLNGVVDPSTRRHPLPFSPSSLKLLIHAEVNT